MTRPAFHSPSLENAAAQIDAMFAKRPPLARPTQEQMAAARAAAYAPRNAELAPTVEKLANLPTDLLGFTDSQISGLIYDAIGFFTQDAGYDVAQVASGRLHDERTRRANDVEAALDALAMERAA